MRHDSGSYDEIMRLTSSRNRGESASTYDFRKTEKFTGDQIKFLEKVFVSFSEAVITSLAPTLQSRFKMELMTIIPRSYVSYVNSLQETTPMLLFKIDDVQGFIDIDFGLAFALFERLMGGKGQAPTNDFRDSFTDLEKAILQKPLVKLLDAYSQAWKDIKNVKPQLSSFEFNPMAVHIASPSELMVIVPFQAEIASAAGAINLVLPFRYLRDCIPKTSFDEFILSKTSPSASPQPQLVAYMTDKLKNAKVPLTVSLGRAELLFQELLSLEVGDTIRLDTEISQPLRVKVNNRTKFLGHPGTKDSKLACKISRVLQDGDEEFDE
ncbi:flagellar motor switch protein FliM [bacterium]|nr:flagellar motor switch protein FliM [bacterium]